MRRKGPTQSSLPVVTSSASAVARKNYVDKWTQLLELELAEETSELERRRRSCSIGQLAKDGFSLVDLECSIVGFRSEDTLLRLSLGLGRPLPFNRLAPGDMVRFSAVSPRFLNQNLGAGLFDQDGSYD